METSPRISSKGSRFSPRTSDVSPQRTRMSNPQSRVSAPVRISPRGSPERSSRHTTRSFSPSARKSVGLGHITAKKHDSDFLDDLMNADTERKSVFSRRGRTQHSHHSEHARHVKMALDEVGSGSSGSGGGMSLHKAARSWKPLKAYCIACLRLPGKLLIRLSILLFDLITCFWRIRYRVRKFNRWVAVGDRQDRLRILRAKRNELTEATRESWKKLGYRNWRVNILLVAQLLVRIYVDSKTFFMEVFGRIDKKTGLPASLLEQWKLTKLLSKGPHGYLYEGVGQTRAHRERTVAVKIRDKSLGQVLNMPIQRSLRILKSEVVAGERHVFMRLLARLNLLQPEFHNICIAELYAVYDNPEFFVEVTEKFSYGSVQSHIEDSGEQLDEHSACAVFRRIVKALEFLHHRRLLHRDVRLNQVLIPKSVKKYGFDDVRLGDFWCVCRHPKRRGLVDDSRPTDVATKAPEVLAQGLWTDKADMWSVGCVLFEMLYGHLPFGGHGKALVQRICTQPPEYDHWSNKPSDLALDLLKGLLRRDHTKRLSAHQCLHHGWVQKFSEPRSLQTVQTIERRIRRVKVYGKNNPARHGMPAENLLKAKTGMFNAGWCSYMGDTACSLDFRIGDEKKNYWVTSITASLWGTEDNPRDVVLMATVRPDIPHSEVLKQRVESPEECQSKLEVDKPLSYIRVRFFKNFGGSYGIALRKLTFYGYEIRAVPIKLEYKSLLFANGSSIYSHNEYLQDLSKVHKTLRNDLEKGEAIPSTGTRYRKYRDVHSGPSHSTTVVGCFLPPFPSGLTIIFASLNLQYVSWTLHNQTPARLRIMVETSDGLRFRLFQTSDLPPSEHEPDSILTFGYDSFPMMFSERFSIPTDAQVSVELHFENNSGYVHIPSNFGLTFYYLPPLTTPSDSDESDTETHEGEAMAKKIASDGAIVKDPSSALENQNIDANAGDRPSFMEGENADDDMSDSEYGRQEEERALHRDFEELEQIATFGAMGSDMYNVEEIPPWVPAIHPLDDEGELTELPANWLDSGGARSGNEYSASTLPPCHASQTTADTMQTREASRASRVSAKAGRPSIFAGRIGNLGKDHEGGSSSDDSSFDEDGQRINPYKMQAIISEGISREGGEELVDENDEMRIKAAFMCKAMRDALHAEMQARARDQNLKHPHFQRNRVSMFASSIVDMNGAECADALRGTALEEHCMPAVQALQGCSTVVPATFQNCVPSRAPPDPGLDSIEDLEPGALPEQSDEFDQQPTDEQTAESQDGCTMQ